MENLWLAKLIIQEIITDEKSRKAAAAAATLRAQEAEKLRLQKAVALTVPNVYDYDELADNFYTQYYLYHSLLSGS
jgi:hypothetical protein